MPPAGLDLHVERHATSLHDGAAGTVAGGIGGLLGGGC
jgi:hypothetical protein